MCIEITNHTKNNNEIPPKDEIQMVVALVLGTAIVSVL